MPAKEMNAIKLGKTRSLYRDSRIVVCTALTFLLVPSPSLLASSSAWAVLGMQDTGANRHGEAMATMSASGEIYSVGGECPPPTATFGDLSHFGTCVTKTDAEGHQVYSVQIGGGTLVEALALDGQGNALIAGSTSPGGVGFPVTVGAYLVNAVGVPDAFVCKLSGTDGHPIYCTFVDVVAIIVPNSISVGAIAGFAIDAAANAYIAGSCGSVNICVEALNPAGTALVYRTTLNTNLTMPPATPNALYIAVDARGDLCLAQANPGIVKLNASGMIAGTATVKGTEVPVGVAVDAAGNPVVVFQDNANAANVHVRRYSADLSAVLFDTPLFLGGVSYPGSNVLGIGIDPAGVTNIWGSTFGVNLQPVHPTDVCYPSAYGAPNSSSAFLARVGANGDVAQFTFLNLLPYFATGAPMLFDAGGASLLYLGANWEIVKLGPATAEIALSCIGNGASFVNGPLAPNEIVSLFGTGLIAGQPIGAGPDANSVYPFQLGAMQVTFDGVAAPLLYASSSQINLVTPHSLQGKSTTHICATVTSVSTNCLDMPVVPAAPGIFTSGVLEDGYTPYAIVLNQDGTINSAQHPAPAGSIITLFATGLGTMTPSPADGALTTYPPPAQDLKVQVTFTWSTSDGPAGLGPAGPPPLYAGPAPLEVEGLTQINVTVPSPPTGHFVFGGPGIQVSVPSPNGNYSLFSPAAALWVK